jgi:hypothetical protein
MAIDPLKRSHVLARFGRVAEAISVLRAALEADPSRSDLRADLDHLERQHKHLGLLGSAKHQIVGWVLLLGSLAALWVPALLLLQYFRSAVDALVSSVGIGLTFVFTLAATLALLYLALELFLNMWFRRLAKFPPNERFLAESALSRGMAIDHFEPFYTNARQRFLPEPDA